MTKKYWAYLLIAFGAAMIYSQSQLTTATGIDASTTLGKLESDLADISVKMSAGTGKTIPVGAYGLVGVGLWLLFG
jgi:hypothetical protein